jgi:hypothetical protein
MLVGKPGRPNFMERRQETRYQIDASAEIKFGTTTIKVKAVEISKHGLRIQSNDFIEPGTKIQTVVFLKEPQQVAGEVKWVVAEPGAAGIVYKIGIFCKSGNLKTDDEPEQEEPAKQEEPEEAKE